MTAIKKVTRYLQGHSRKLFEYIEDNALRIGNTLDQDMDNALPRRTIVCKFLLRLPLIFIIHHWLLLSPYSYNWAVETFLFFARYGVALQLVDIFTFNTGAILQFYTISTFDTVVMWLKRTDYWTHQKAAYGNLHDKNALVWSNNTNIWSVFVLCSSLLQFVYLCYRPGAFIHRKKGHVTTCNYISIFATMIPNILSAFGFIPSFMSQLSYCIESTTLYIVCLYEIISSRKLDLDIDKKKLKILTDDRNLRCKHNDRIKDLRQRICNRRGIGYYAYHYLGKWTKKFATMAFGTIALSLSRRNTSSNVILSTILDVCSMLFATAVDVFRSLLPKFLDQIF